MRYIKIIDKGFLVLLSALCVLYSIYASTFAEVHIKFPFLDFPIFIGEIAMFFCVLWLAVRWVLLVRPRHAWTEIGMAYVIWVICRALSGYMLYGPLAFRNAALFYYPFFAVFTYWISKEKHFIRDSRTALFLFSMILVVKAFGIFSYFFFPYLALAIILLMRFKNVQYKVAGALIVIIIFPFQELFDVSRAALLGHMTAIIFLGIFSVIIYSRVNKKVKQVLMAGIPLILLCAFLYFAAEYKINSLIKVQSWIQEFQKQDRLVQVQKKDLKVMDIKPQLYNSNLDVVAKRISIYGTPEVPHRGDAIADPKDPLRIAQGNILFRLFIWRDMIQEYLKGNWLTGINLGKPFRSMSIEIIGMANGEWSRDGWIMPHNAYVNMVCRGGVVGMGMVFGIMGMWIYMVRVFVASRAFEGILLCSVLIYWLVVSFFSVTLELPYQAIPFWSLWGLAWAYCFSEKKRISVIDRRNK